MKILYVTQFFYPERIAASFRAYANATNWQNLQSNVTVFTTYPNYPLGRVFKEYENYPDFFEEDVSGVRVFRSKIAVKDNQKFINRAENAYSFKHYAIKNMKKYRQLVGTDYDVVVGSSGPIFAAQAGNYFAKKYGIPFVFEIRDLTYKQLQATGSPSSSWKVRLMRRWELDLCRNSNRVVVLTKGFKSILCDEGIPEGKIQVIPNGVDLKRTASFRNRNANELNELRIGYFGTIGISQDIDTVLEYIAIISDFIDLKFSIIGAGAQSAHVKDLINHEYSFASIEKQKTPEALEADFANSNICVVSLKKSKNFSATLPSKMFQIMGRGLPVLFIGPSGEASELIASNNAGIVLNGTREQDIANLRLFFSSPDWKEKLEIMGTNGRRLVESKYSRRRLSEEYLSVLKAATTE